MSNSWLRLGVITVLVVTLVGGIYLAWPGGKSTTIVGYFSSAVGLYPGDDVRVIGVPVGSITAIEPQADAVKITMALNDGVRVPADAHAIIVAPNLVSARFIQLTPTFTGGQAMAAGASIGLDRTGVPVEWDEVKEELTKLSKTLGPQSGSAGPLSEFVNQAADTFDGNGDSFRQALRELSQTAGRLGDSRTDLFGTVKNLQTLVNALSNSNEQIVQFSGHLASVSQVLADSTDNLDSTLGTLNQALTDVRGFLHDNNDALIAQVTKLTDFTKILSDQHDDIEQLLHVTPNGLANFYNIYNPAQGTLAGLLSLPNFQNPVQFICGGSFDSAATIDNYKRAEVCRERMGPVLRRLTMNFPPLLFHPINSITAYKGQIVYDTPETQAKAQTPIPDLHWQPAPGVQPPEPPQSGDLSAFMVPATPPADGAAPAVQPGAPLPAEAPGPAPSGGGR